MKIFLFFDHPTKDNLWECLDSDHCTQECKTYGSGHIDTFDELQYSHKSLGEFVFAIDQKSLEWEVLVEYRIGQEY